MTGTIKIAFMGYNQVQTYMYFREFAEVNAEAIDRVDFKKGLILLKDGTVIMRVYPGQHLDGYRFDQYILADDTRGQIYSYQRDSVAWLRYCCATSRYPEEFWEQWYNLDAH